MSNASSIAALVLGVGLVGVVGFQEIERRREKATGTSGSTGTGTTLPGVSNLVPTGGSVATKGDLAALQKQNDINTLRRDLARIQNDMDVQIAAANALKNASVSPDFAQAVTQKVWDDCKASHKFFPGVQCSNAGTGAKAAEAVKTQWAAKVATDLQPVQAQLSRLNSEQLATIQNLRALGFEVPAADVRKGSV